MTSCRLAAATDDAAAGQQHGDRPEAAEGGDWVAADGAGPDPAAGMPDGAEEAEETVRPTLLCTAKSRVEVNL